MKFPLYLFVAASMATPLAVFAADQHEHHAAAKSNITLNAGKKWATDAPLRKAMTTLGAAVASALPNAHAGTATAADYDALSREAKAQVVYIVQNCKLDAKADEQLHTIIADILNGAKVAEGKEAGTERALGVVQIAQALNTYGKYFQHPGWKTIPLPH